MYIIPKLILCVGLLFSNLVSTQGISGIPNGDIGDLLGNPLNIYVDDINPSPGEEVRISITGNTGDVRGVRSVLWRINNNIQEQFTNQTVFNYVVGGAGSIVEINADIVFFDERGIRKDLVLTETIVPTIFDISWEGTGFTHPRYRGHKTPSSQSDILISTLIRYTDANGTRYDEKDFTYLWEINNKTSGGLGLGKSYITIPASNVNFSSRTISIEVTATLITDSNFSLNKTIYIPVKQNFPLVLYVNDPVNGLHDIVVGNNNTILKTPITFSAYPYFFSKESIDDDGVIFEWYVNNSKTQRQGRKIDVSLKGERVFVPFSINVRNKDVKKQFQTTSNTLNLNI